MKKYKHKGYQHSEDPVYWCDTCNLLLLNQACDACNDKGREIKLSQPTDIRLASTYEYELINQALTNIYGSNIGRKLVFLNKTSGVDKTDEIIIDGRRFATLSFDIFSRNYTINPDIHGAKLLLQSAEKQVVKIKPQKRHIKGKNIPAEEILEIPENIDETQDVIVTGKNIIGVGRIKQDNKGNTTHLTVRKIDRKTTVPSLKNPGLPELLQANRLHMKKITLDATNVIKGTVNQKKHKDAPLYVSFSGGKDSLVCLDLAKKADKNVKAFFADTGIEFPETTDYIKYYCEKTSTPLQVIPAGDAFWNNVESFGPPGKDYRWCCKVCKLAPLNQVPGGQKIVTVDGKRRYESFARSKIPTTEDNPLIPGQTNIYPIRNWRAIEVWLYIHYRQLEYNTLYDQGFERVGCYLCPAALQSEYHRLKDLHPELFERWERYLQNWAKTQGLPPEYAEFGFWRWKQHPPKMLELATQHNITTTGNPAVQGDFSITTLKGVSPCTAGGYSIEGTLKGLTPLETRRILNIIGEFQYVSELGVSMAKKNTASVKIFDTGNLIINAPTEIKARELLGAVQKQLTRLARCTQCKLCTHACPQKAITLPLQISAECTHCNKCTRTCPLTRYN